MCMAHSDCRELWGKHFHDVGKFSWTTPHTALMIVLPFGNWSQILITELPSWWRIVTSDAHEHGGPQGTRFDRWESFTQFKRINHHLSRCCLYAQITIHIFLAASMISNKHRTFVPRPTDGGNPVGVIYTTDKEELLDSERSAYEQSLSGTRNAIYRHIVLMRTNVIHLWIVSQSTIFWLFGPS